MPPSIAGETGDLPEACFGADLRIAADGPNLVVADTRRHSVLWFHVDPIGIRGRIGDTDKPGDRLGAFDHPPCVGISGDSVAVLDSVNGCLVKAALTE